MLLTNKWLGRYYLQIRDFLSHLFKSTVNLEQRYQSALNSHLTKTIVYLQSIQDTNSPTKSVDFSYNIGTWFWNMPSRFTLNSHKINLWRFLPSLGHCYGARLSPRKSLLNNILSPINKIIDSITGNWFNNEGYTLAKFFSKLLSVIVSASKLFIRRSTFHIVV